MDKFTIITMILKVTGTNFISTAALDSSRYGTGINLIDADMAISNCHFENQRFGISKHNTWPGGKGITSVRKNSFENCRWYILLDGGDFTRIVGNTFNIPHGIDTFQIAVGIVNDGSNAVQIKDGNSFGASDANNSFFIYSGKLVDQHASEITRNIFGRADSSSWRQVELHGAQDSLQIFCNDFKMSGGSEFAVGLDDGTTLMTQGTPERPAGNDWNTLESCILGTNDESHIYSDNGNDAFQYFGFSDRVPDCVSHNVDTIRLNTGQLSDYCNIPTPCPPPTIPCGAEMLDSTLLVIDTLLYRPPFGMSQAEIDRNLGYARHTKNIIVQDILIDLLEQDSIELALEWLDSVVMRMDEFDSLHLLMLDRYDDLLQRPDHSGHAMVTSSLMLKEAIYAKSNTPRELVPLIRKNNSLETATKIAVSPTSKIYEIWPNPVGNEFHIKWNKHSTPEQWRIIVNDIHGKVKLNSGLISGEKTTFNVSNWTSGIYFMSIISENTLIGVEKMIIIK